MLEKDHFCEFEAFEIRKISKCAQEPNQNSLLVPDIAEDLVFCVICGENLRGDSL